jgi:hypothetical protein
MCEKHALSWTAREMSDGSRCRTFLPVNPCMKLIKKLITAAHIANRSEIASRKTKKIARSK